MHACGHDGHTAMRRRGAPLAATRQFSGTLNLIFQPAEENFGGAKAMMDEPVRPLPVRRDLRNPQHAGPRGRRHGLPHRAAMASADRVTITLRGVGGHGAMPHFARDPMSAAGSIMVALQTIVAREVDAQHAAVITVGSVQAGETFNIIPETVTMKLSVRALNADVRARAASKRSRKARRKASASRRKSTTTTATRYSSITRNRPRSRPTSRQMLGAERVETDAAR